MSNSFTVNVVVVGGGVGTSVQLGVQKRIGTSVYFEGVNPGPTKLEISYGGKVYSESYFIKGDCTINVSI